MPTDSRRLLENFTTLVDNLFCLCKTGTANVDLFDLLLVRLENLITQIIKAMYYIYLYYVPMMKNNAHKHCYKLISFIKITKM